MHTKDDHTGTPLLREHERRAENRRKIAAGTFRLDDLAGLDHATVVETAAVYRADPRTIRAYIKAGKIPATFLGEWRVPVRWLLAQAQAESVSA